MGSNSAGTEVKNPLANRNAAIVARSVVKPRNAVARPDIIEGYTSTAERLALVARRSQRGVPSKRPKLNEASTMHSIKEI
mmetsp:Transcript_14118/g.26469  ORF Transcript_14118/g.26469 Transcript_14118/m.26469 type:complete len:80 (-) Transcript_14118:830-1069(-)